MYFELINKSESWLQNGWQVVYATFRDIIL